MVPEDLLSQGLAIDVRVNLGSAYILVPKHKADGLQISPTIE